ncbi:MAG: hypothetical protein D6679_07100, partial [Candidatus Hydrogenedentota bacterium]
RGERSDTLVSSRVLRKANEGSPPREILCRGTRQQVGATGRSPLRSAIGSICLLFSAVFRRLESLRSKSSVPSSPFSFSLLPLPFSLFPFAF